MVSDPFLVGVFFGFVPGMGFLYILLKEFQAFYQEKRVFRAFFIGMGVGLLATFAEVILGPAPDAIEGGPAAALALYSFLLAALEVGAFAVVLNWKTYRAKRDTPYYAVAFGLGFGATNVLFLVGNLVAGLETGQTGYAEAVFVAILGLYFIGSILVHAAVGAWIGRGVSQGGLVGNLLLAIVTRGAYLSGFYAMFRLQSPLASIALPFVGATIGVALVAHVIRDVLRPIVPPEILREMEIHKRRIAREVVRPETRSKEDETPTDKAQEAPRP